MPILNSNNEVVHLKTLQRAYPNISFGLPIQQETLDKLEITDFRIGEVPVVEVIDEPADPAVAVRNRRNGLLSDTDWTQLSDSPALNDDAWTTYRQQLRDIPLQDGFPNDVTWPVVPGQEPEETSTDEV